MSLFINSVGLLSRSICLKAYLGIRRMPAAAAAKKISDLPAAMAWSIAFLRSKYQTPSVLGRDGSD
jgi:hypothetical protein